MLPTDKEYVEAVRLLAKYRITGDTLLSPTPVYLYAVFVTPTDSKTTQVDIYDGHNASGELILRLKTRSQATFVATFSMPMYFRQGLFADCKGDMDSVTFHYLPVKE